MKAVVTLAMTLAVAATAMVGVCERTLARHLQYRVWELERRRERLERRILRVAATARAGRTPRALLEAQGGAYDRSGSPEFESVGETP